MTPSIFSLQLAGFGLLSCVLVYLSRKPLRSRAAHGFTRFFAWEAILGLLVVNAPVWHDDLFSPRQLASWALLFTSPVIAVLGVRALKTEGQPSELREDRALYGFEKTERLVTSGIFGHIRHPMYTALLLLAWGIYLKGLGPLTTALVAIATLCLWWTARRDEAECLAFFGEPYARYMKSSKRFVPRIF